MEEVTDVIGNGFTGSIMEADSRDVKGWGGCEGGLHRVRVQALFCESCSLACDRHTALLLTSL